MKNIFVIFTTAFTLLLSGCLAHMSATNAANRLNVQAEREGNPYRWIVTDLEGDRAKLEQKLSGEVGSSKVTGSKKQHILAKIEQLEVANGRATKPQLKEVRILPQASSKSAIVEAWVLDNSGKDIVYSVEHTPGTDDQDFIIRGPWGKRS